jgi:hypothetical protein
MVHAHAMRALALVILVAACGAAQNQQPLQSSQDVDRDAIPDVVDKCPYQPGIERTGGCPETADAGSEPQGTSTDQPPLAGAADRDSDTIPDASDQCPDRPEDRDGFNDQDGCPELDNDADGIADLADRCPDVPEDKDGTDDSDGCPDP